jgi:hypothetical protein
MEVKMKHDENNVILDDILNQDGVNSVRASISRSFGSNFIQEHCQANLFIQLEDTVVEKFTRLARQVSGNNNLVLKEHCFARYENVTSNCGKFHFKPSLFPHYDETFKEPRFTFDYQLSSNISWPIFVEPDKEFVLKDNQAITFSGTHQVHWRKPTLFKDGDFVEMIFCHFSDPTSGPKEPDLNERMDKKVEGYRKAYFEAGGWTNGSDS